MSEDFAPVEYRNRVGTAQWQPRLPNGEMLWWDSNYADGWFKTFHSLDSGHGAVLYRSRRRAIRVARREWKRRHRAENVRTYKRVRDDEGGREA